LAGFVEFVLAQLAARAPFTSITVTRASSVLTQPGAFAVFVANASQLLEVFHGLTRVGEQVQKFTALHEFQVLSLCPCC